MRINQLENNKEIYNNYNIVHLPKEQWKDTIIFMKDDVDSDNNSEKLYQEEYNNAYVWGVFDGDGDNARLIACIETCPMEEANAIEVIKLWVDGSNFDAFLGIELVEGGLKDFGGVFIEPKVFEDLPEEENEEFTKNFDVPKKQKFPCQWD